MDFKGDMQHRALLMDVGGSHVGSLLLPFDSLSAAEPSRTPLDHSSNLESILQAFELAAWAALGQTPDGSLPQALWRSGVAVASLGLPGPFDYEDGVSWMEHKFAALRALSLRRLLAERFGLRAANIVFLNDAAACGLGEANFGLGVGRRRVISLTLGTGIGSAYCVDGHLVVDGHGVPPGGEIWCSSFRRGVVEDFISTRAIVGYYRNFSGKDATAREIAERARSYDAAASAAWRQFGSLLGDILSSLCSEFRPDLVVLGGAMSQSSDLFLPAVRMRLRGQRIRVKPSAIFDRAAMLGLLLRARAALV